MKRLNLNYMMQIVILLVLSSGLFACENNNDDSAFTRIDSSKFLDTLQFKTFLYFIDEINPDNGLVKDRSSDDSPASIAATGFAIPVWAIGAEKGWIQRQKAAELTLNLLNFLIHSEQSTERFATGYKGFYYHFLDMQTGKRVWDCELSSIDTGLLFAGLIFARQYYKNNNDVEIIIRELTEKIIGRADWEFFTLPDSGLCANTLSIGWSPEKGLYEWGWRGYNEAHILYIIAAGLNMPGVKKAYDAWGNEYDWREPYPGLLHTSFPPLFGHHYSHMFVDFRGLSDKFLIPYGIDYFENARRAVYVQREYAISNPNEWKGYDSLTWGLTACDGPGFDYNYDDKVFQWYAARGTSGPGRVDFDDGTIAPTASAASLPFAPEIVLPTILNLYQEYGKQGLWGKYGFKDSFNPTLNWYAQDYLGIDQGPIVLMIENYKTGFVWKYFMNDPIIKKGLEVLGIEEK